MQFDVVDNDALLDFAFKTKFDLRVLLSEITSFFKSDVYNIYAFYQGGQKRYPKSTYEKLEALEQKIDEACGLLTESDSSFNDYRFFVILDLLEDTKTRLETLKNYSRWARKGLNLNINSNGIEVDYVQKQGETLERIGERVFMTNSNDDWYDIAVRNNLREEDYTQAGGTAIKLTFDRVDDFFVETVVDIIDTGEKIFGKDLDRKIQFADDDLKTLTNRDTVFQSANILASLRKNHNPEFPALGIDEKFLGSNKNAFLYPAIIRQLSEIFRTDDSFRSISITEIKVEKDGVIIEAEIETRLNDFQQVQIDLS